MRPFTRTLYAYRTFAVALLILLVNHLDSYALLESGVTTLVSTNACWHFNDHGFDLGTEWANPDYDDSAWAMGNAELGYGDGDEATVVSFGPDPADKYITTYFRRTFVAPDPTAFTNVLLRLKCDGGAAVYLNGQEMFRTNLPPGPLSYLTLATGDDTNFVTSNLSPTLLQAGENTLTVETHLTDTNSPHLSFDLGLVGQYDASSPILNVVSASAKNFVLSWPTSANASFALQSASTLNGTFTPVTNSVVGVGSLRYVTNALTPSARFYRLYAAPLSLPPCQPVIVRSQPLKVEVPTGTNVSLNVVVNGSAPITYDWRKNQISANNSTATLTLTNVQRETGGAYDVLLCNSCSCSFSCPIVLIVGGTNVALADNFDDRPNFTAAAAWLNTSNAVATTEADEPAYPAPAYGRTLWLEWTAPASGIATFDTRGSALAMTLSVYTGDALTNLVLETSAGPSGPASTSKVVFNATGGTAYQVRLDGYGPTPNICLNWALTATANVTPQIVLQPASAYVYFGSNAAFTVQATLPPPLTNSLIAYQWYKEITPIAGATNTTLNLPFITSSNIAQYFAVARFGGFNATSSIVTLSGLSLGLTVGSGSISPPITSFGGQYPCGALGGKFDHHLLYYFRVPANTAAPCSPLLCGLGSATPGNTIKTDPYFQPASVNNGSCSMIDVTLGDCGTGTPTAATKVTFDTLTGNAGTINTSLYVAGIYNCNSPTPIQNCYDNVGASPLSSTGQIALLTANVANGLIKVFVLYSGTLPAGTTAIQLNYKYCP